jgi:hypothetical protein
MQKWEYKIVHRIRRWEFDKARDAYRLTDWDISLAEMLPALGDEGWELVALAPRSAHYGAESAGTTTEDIWVFKRPKAEAEPEAA